VHILDDGSAAGASRRKREIEHGPGAGTNKGCNAHHIVLSPAPAHRTSARVPDLFDMKLRAMRRDRAARMGPELFVLERVFEDCLERIALLDRRFDRALLIGCPDSEWPERMASIAEQVDTCDPGRLFAQRAAGSVILENAWEPGPQACDLVLAIGTLDSTNDLPLALRLIHYALSPDGLFIGALSGGETVPKLRAAMRAADALTGIAVPHAHPRIEPSALAPLLEDAGFSRPVVDIERVAAGYTSLGRLVRDLRAMAATNVLASRPPPLTRRQWEAAARAFEKAAEDGRTIETFEIIHFAAWKTARR
jgi:SAM-dependent methyltransferase